MSICENLQNNQENCSNTKAHTLPTENFGSVQKESTKTTKVQFRALHRPQSTLAQSWEDTETVAAEHSKP